MVKVAASVLDLDFSKKEEWLKELEEAKVDRIHWDLMDNKYVPNTGVPSEKIAELRPLTKIFFESHLMIEKPEEQVKQFAKMGNELLIFHVETTKEPRKLIAEIKGTGMKAGISVNNETSVEKIFPYLNEVDLALVMSVQAGFGGQKFNPIALEKISLLNKKIDEESFNCEIEVDGGVNSQTALKCVENGADILAVGSGIFKNPKGIKEAVLELKGKNEE